MKKKFAVFCPLKDEKTFSPIWLKYYCQFLSKDDIYILDFGSKDLSHLDCQIVNCDKDIFDATQLFQSIKDLHTELLKSYEYVIPTDVDEILFHPKGLDNYIQSLTCNWVKARGYELVHLPEHEPDLNINQLIMDQRRFWFRNSEYYDKTLITNKTLNWWIGLHGTYDPIDKVDDDLVLIHLHRFDYKICIERHLRWANQKWSEDTILNNYNWHYRQLEEESVKKWYYSFVSLIEEIPKELREKINI
jgi:hypothetical protein